MSAAPMMMRGPATAVVPRRPGFVTFLALMAAASGVTYLSSGLSYGLSLGDLGLTTTERTSALALIIYGVLRLMAAHGLLLLRGHGRALEMLSALVWIGAVLAIAFAWRNPAAKPLAALGVPGLLLALVELVYLRGASARALFEQQQLPLGEVREVVPSSRMGLLIGAEIGVTLLLVAVLVPNLKKNITGTRPQQRTMSDLRMIATAVEAYATDHNRYPAARNLAELEPLVTPTYLRQLPLRDGWRNDFQYQAWAEPGREGPQHYAVASVGQDRKLQLRQLRDYRQKLTDHPDCDIVYSDGTFIWYPRSLSGYDKDPVAEQTAAPAGKESKFDRATVLYRADRCGEAIPLFEEFIALNPDHALAHARLGLCYGYTGRLEKSVATLERAAALDPGDWMTLSNVGTAWDKLGKPEKGIEPIRRALSIQPDQPALLNNYGWVLLRAKRPAEAIVPLEKAVRISPRDGGVRFNLASAYLDAGRIDRARQESRVLRRLDANLADELDRQLARSR